MAKFQWWTELTHSGIFISSPVLNEYFKERHVETWHWKYKRLRDNYNLFLSEESVYRSGHHPIHAWITNLFEEFLGHDSNHWLKGQNIPQLFTILSKTGMPIKPWRVLTDQNGEAILLLQRDESQRLGIHNGRRSYTQFVELLRKTNVSLGMLTNGHQIIMVYAGLDDDSWVQFQMDTWFDEEETCDQLDGFLTLLHPDALKVENGSFPLLGAVNTSRRRQADLVDVLGEQTRQSVEILTSVIGRVQQTNMKFLDIVKITPGTGSILSEADTLNAVYQAATRLVMRKVILFYAEAKRLLPKDNSFFFDNYSIEGLYSRLFNAVQQTGEEELKTRYTSWQQLLALSNIVHRGSEHELLPLKAYGGVIFQRGDTQSVDVVLRALSLFEQPNIGITDYEVYRILRFIKIGKTKVRQGRNSTYVREPVDFDDMRTEYIGMMYEGLLDYELKKVDQDDPKVILNIGNEPILPLKLLEPMEDAAIKNLFKKLKKGGALKPEEGLMAESDLRESTTEHLNDSTVYRRSLRWMVKVVEVASLIPRLRGTVSEEMYEKKKLEKARSLIVSVLEPGEMYLSCRGGTRKGSGTFYTNPSLAVPTTWRTLEPLVYNSADEDKKVKTPKHILNLKVCDPAVGSGTFLVASARYLTEVLYESVLTHILTQRNDDGNVIIKPSEQVPLTLDVQFEVPPINPTDDGWEAQMKARLKRFIVERCLFGVDCNGMAVELARLTLWLETMDKDLPFEFLDHHIKQGNSLVGTWFKQYADYPFMAWEREGGDGIRGALTQKIKQLKTNVIKPDLAQWLNRCSDQYSIIEEKQSDEETIQTHLKTRTFSNKTSLFDTNNSEEVFYKNIGEEKEYNRLKKKFDRWISIWFWPVNNDKIPLLKPSNFEDEDERINNIVEDLKSSYHFFHWELEFPEVFMEKGGFDAILGNPPWNTLQPESLEFFSNYDPFYRTYGKQEALLKQREIFETNPSIYDEWIDYSAYFKGITNFIKASNNPFEVSLGRGNENQYLLDKWQSIRNHRKGYIQGRIPYQHQGSGKIDLYQLFLELSYQLINEGGRLGMISPSGIYTDKGNTDLRTLFIENANWEWLFMFENRKKVFDIHASFKFGPLILTKGGKTESVKCAFMRHDIKEWESAYPSHIVMPVKTIKRFSPKTLSFMEFKSEMDLEICEKIYGDRPLLGEDVKGGWNVKFAQEFNMTSHSHLFSPITQWIEEGYKSDGLGRWVNDDGDIALPVYEGRMIGQFDFSENGWVLGKGRSAVWRKIPFDDKKIEPQFLMSRENFIEHNSSIDGYKIPVMNISSATNSRTAIAGFVKDFPCIHSLNPITLKNGTLFEYLCVCAIVNSFAFDYLIRFKMGGLNLSFFVLEETVFPEIPKNILYRLAFETAKLLFIHPIFIPEWELLIDKLNPIEIRLATELIERKRIRCIIDSLIFYTFGLNEVEVERIIENNPNNPTGFFRVDSNLSIEQRQTSLTLKAFKHLNQVGLERFLEEGWGLPDYITEFEPQGIKIWGLEGGWEKNWANAKSMLTKKEWKELSGKSTQVLKEENEGIELVQQGLF